MPFNCSGWSVALRLRPGPPVSYALTSSSTCVCRRQMLYLGTDAAAKVPCGELFMRTTMRPGSGNASGLSSTVLITEKIAVLAPIPSANAITAVAVKPGLFRSIRKACLRSAASVSISESLIQIRRRDSPFGSDAEAAGFAMVTPGFSLDRSLRGIILFGIPPDRRRRLLLSRLEPHLNLGFHLNWMTTLHRGLIMKLTPRHSLAKLRAGIELGNLPINDEDPATRRTTGGFPKRCG